MSPTLVPFENQQQIVIITLKSTVINKFERNTIKINMRKGQKTSSSVRKHKYTSIYNFICTSPFHNDKIQIDKELFLFDNTASVSYRKLAFILKIDISK